MEKKFSPLQCIGFFLIIGSLCLLLAFHFSIRAAADQAKQTCSLIESLIPQRSPGIPGMLVQPEMAALEVNGEDYLGLLDVPRFGVTLPIGSTWDIGTLQRHYWGSVHNNSLVIGGACHAGQFDFCEELEIGDMVTVTDMTGAEFCYRVSHIGRSRHADSQWLCQDDYDLTIFARTAFSLEYIAVRCTLSPN